VPKEAKKEDVVFEATTDQLQELVLESEVPVLLDVYADWYENLIGSKLETGCEHERA
jgi:thiol:disulfide interchange protein